MKEFPLISSVKGGRLSLFIGARVEIEKNKKKNATFCMGCGIPATLGAG